mmetsp:Transcript_6817/g.19296  ORF Transcript_6817/g.19296 Transcript_6817/m.19296 type:complete len:260 (+) Transcript_6817:1053-1832(+)
MGTSAGAAGATGATGARLGLGSDAAALCFLLVGVPPGCTWGQSSTVSAVAVAWESAGCLRLPGVLAFWGCSPRASRFSFPLFSPGGCASNDLTMSSGFSRGRRRAELRLPFSPATGNGVGLGPFSGLEGSSSLGISTGVRGLVFGFPRSLPINFPLKAPAKTAESSLSGCTARPGGLGLGAAAACCCCCCCLCAVNASSVPAASRTRRRKAALPEPTMRPTASSSSPPHRSSAVPASTSCSPGTTARSSPTLRARSRRS